MIFVSVVCKGGVSVFRVCFCVNVSMVVSSVKSNALFRLQLISGTNVKFCNRFQGKRESSTRFAISKLQL